MHLSRYFGTFLITFALPFLIAPDAPASEYQGVRVIAHRGAGHEFDENTLEGCQQSYGRGLRGFEVDIRLTKDDQLVLMHDAESSRTTKGTGKIEELTLAQVRELRTKDHGVPVPAMADLVAYFKDKPDVTLLLELKTSDTKVYSEERLATYGRLVAAAVKDLPKGTFWFTSFDRRVLALMKRLLPEAPTGLLTGTPPTPAFIQEALDLGCGRLSVSLDHTNRQYAHEVKKAGLQISLWPIRSKEDADLAVMLGANILCTDVPSDLLASQRNQAAPPKGSAPERK
ncbi:glycerophosphodiester phosphodiesterase [Verrucomicrobium sp. BvORR106]|uniref:glycerophosphodiester phosphodiesterase n=1 Tax=Verrucomicrobium sp. BvORR106 TaxID=1403819 RepID=UPI0005717DE4|nr:glycerophosphodiester phosphodiesterase [Verrucomicrobium sp. BvORR106]